jgi:hypothetical protein
MKCVLAILLACLAIGVAGCEQVSPGVALTKDGGGGSEVLILSSPGGDVDAFDRAFRRWSRIPGVRVEIRQWCASACTQVFSYFTPGQICLASGARLGFHSAVQRDFAFHTDAAGRSAGFGVPKVDSISTLLVFAGYPGWIQQRLAADGVMGVGPGNPLLVMGASEFWRRGYGVCAEAGTAKAA